MIILRRYAVPGGPAHARIQAFVNYFSSLGTSVIDVASEENKIVWYRVLLLLIRSREREVFISMPPFKFFWLFFIPGLKVILDIRDGWSIAMASGYGGTSKLKPIKAKVARFVERLIVRRASYAITCTPGLEEYLSKISSKEVLLIPNGVLDEDLVLMEQLRQGANISRSFQGLIFCCAGQFSEYGVDKVKKLCEVIIGRYDKGEVKIRLIGADYKKNLWLNDFLADISGGRASVEFFPRMSKCDLYVKILESDFGLVILRDPAYEFGTKIYDYIGLGVPVINYFDSPNGFTDYFDACLDVSFSSGAQTPELRRSVLVGRALDEKRAKL